ncbi:hypothetical protein LINGRAHAP2_LOCUS29073 [Linum grandiflorum]
MYRELGKASRANSKKFSGCMTLLQSWIYEYFPSLRGADSPASRDVGAPLAGRWDDVGAPLVIILDHVGHFR